jgi:cell division protein FtsA
MGRLGNFFQTHLPRGRKVRSKNDYLLALDIGTEFVKALIFKIVESSSDNGERVKQGLVIGVGRQRQPAGQMQAGAVTDIEGVTLTCQQAIEQAVQMARLKPTRVVIGIAGEFIKGTTVNFVYQRANPGEEIGLAELQNIIQKIQWKAFDRMRRQLAWETGRAEVEIRLINALITEIRIDGYQVTNPLGFQGREIFLSIFNAYAPLVHLQALESIAARLDLDLLSIAVEPYALTKSSGFNPGAGAIFIDIGGGTTDIALVRRNGLEGIKSFALAGRTFTKRLCQEFGLGMPEAEEIKTRYTHQQLSQGVRRKIREIFRKDIGIWLTGVELILEEFNQVPPQALHFSPGQVQFFPPLILLCGGGSLLPGIKSILKRGTIQNEWLSKFSFSQPPQIRFIQPNHITNIIDQTDILRGPEDITPIALANLALEIVADEEKVLPAILRRVVRMMR